MVRWGRALGREAGLCALLRPQPPLTRGLAVGYCVAAIGGARVVVRVACAERTVTVVAVPLVDDIWLPLILMGVAGRPKVILRNQRG